ncbi:hypothetical protein [Candidatus Stoquefichus sp. SB1]|uniref:hypothetical protein n=1 Tax=Candidatus Stoquefichus sp. SB1 TaxID=1658109 RepID=UPI00067EDB7D|nr:hypothetical protein [Candidatus Stoquefichus sp. SB1]
MQQLQFDLFNEFDQYNPSLEEISFAKSVCIKHIFEEHLSKFGIDDFYVNRVKPKQLTLGKIKNELCRQTRYIEYFNEFCELCKKYLNLTTYENNSCGICIEYDYVRYFMDRKSGPAYCMSMLPDKVFENGIKEEWK